MVQVRCKTSFLPPFLFSKDSQQFHAINVQC
uniref:Uncharacterized protein n=1 Tax=Anguilla anguilla TaxID=7936 RepID=A0A0E9UT23_ANGAN